MARAALSYKPFRYFISARLLLILAVQMQSLVLSWMVYELTHNPFSLGLIGLAEIIPFLSVVLFAGTLADKYNRKKIILLAQIVILITTLLLMFIALNQLNLSKQLQLVLIYSIVIIFGLARGFYGPASQSILPQLVLKKDFTNATTWNTSVFHFSAIAGPALGGVLYGFVGLLNCVFILIILQCISFAIALMIPYKPQTHLPKSVQGTWQQIIEGWQFVWNKRVLKALLSLDLLAVLFGGATALLPVFAAEVLMCGARGLGVLRAAPAIGALVMGGLLIFFPPGKNAGRNLIFSVLAFGLCMTVFAFSRNYYLSIIILALSGAFDNISVVIRQTVVQLETPDHMRGRVASVNSIFIGLSNEIGAFESGLAARILGLVSSVAAGGLISSGIAVIYAKVFPELFKLNMQPKNNTPF